MEKHEYMAQCEDHLFHVYNRFPVVFDHGKDMCLYDTDGKEYLDFASGIGVNAFGYGNKEFQFALENQIRKLLHTSNLYYHTSLGEAAADVCRITGMDRVFFTNSGAEAIEGAIKTAKKYAFLQDGKNGQEIIAFEHSFHGRTVGALSVTGTEHYRAPFYPLMDGVRFAKFNDFASVEALVNDHTCAILMETIQGEGGIYPVEEEFLKALRELCTEKDILLILDEIQCGMGRTGQMYAYQHYDIRPDIVTTAKALGGGVPVGAFAVTEKVAKTSLVPGDHGTTYGGNPLVCAAVHKSIDMMEELELPKHVRETTPYLEKKLQELTDKYDFVTGHRGMGYMQGLILTIPVADVVKNCLKAGLVVLSAGSDVLRLLPPLIADEEDFDRGFEILDSVLSEF